MTIAAAPGRLSGENASRDCLRHQFNPSWSNMERQRDNLEDAFERVWVIAGLFVLATPIPLISTFATEDSTILLLFFGLFVATAGISFLLRLLNLLHDPRRCQKPPDAP
jgi:hypothetical protein